MIRTYCYYKRPMNTDKDEPVYTVQAVDLQTADQMARDNGFEPLELALYIRHSSSAVKKEAKALSKAKK